MSAADWSNPPMPNSRIIRKGQNVARYDDDYPLLYGEPAPQPQWDTAGIILGLGQLQSEQQQAGSETSSAGLQSGR
jgi:hypothetical protein